MRILLACLLCVVNSCRSIWFSPPLNLLSHHCWLHLISSGFQVWITKATECAVYCGYFQSIDFHLGSWTSACMSAPLLRRFLSAQATDQKPIWIQLRRDTFTFWTWVLFFWALVSRLSIHHQTMKWNSWSFICFSLSSLIFSIAGRIK